MRIRDVQLGALSLRLRQPLTTSQTSFSTREGVRVTVHADGAAGVGEAMPLTSFGTEDAGEAMAALSAAREALIDREVPEHPSELDALLDGIAPLAGAPAARHGLETALLEAVGHRAKTPLRRLLSPTALDVIDVNALATKLEADALAAQAQEAADRGFRVIKLKVGHASIEEDLLRVAAVRSAIGPYVRLRLDANGAWSRADAAARLTKLCAYGVELCEQPVPAGEVEALRALRGTVPCAIAADEACATVAAASALIDGGGADVLVLRPMVLGGVVRALNVARKARAAGLGAYVASSLEGPVGHAAAASLAAALGASGWVHGLATQALLVDVPPSPLVLREGRLWFGAEHR